MEAQEFSVVIQRPLSEVFAYLDNIDEEMTWQPNPREVEQIPPGPSVVGSKKRYVSEFMGKRVENTYEVVEMGPGWRVVYQSTPDSTLGWNCQPGFPPSPSKRKTPPELLWPSVPSSTRLQ